MSALSKSFKRAYRYAFNGKEKDDETYGEGNEYDFGARIHSSRLGQFLSIDPLTKKYPYWSPYLFAGNNPIRFIDVNGEGPGDLFKSMDEAASDFGKSYNDNSIVNKREYGTVIIRVKKHGEVFYTYTKPVKGFNGSVLPPNPLFRKKVAYAHTHSEGDGEGSYNHFSVGDYEYADSKKKPFYVATPDGSLLKYDPNKSYKNGENQHDVINSEQPSDPIEGKHRKNNIDATSSSLPKNEPSRRTRIIQLLFSESANKKKKK
jgi:RHS repeat-associated protein